MGIKITITILLLAFVNPLFAQSWSEWFSQKSTQKKYLLEQIAALKVYAGYLKKGYDVAKDGTSVVGDIKNGEFSLHKDYFNSLKTVNPAIKNGEKIEAIIKMQQAMLLLRQNALYRSTESGQFTAREIRSMRKRLDGLREEASRDLDELTMVTADGSVEMTDDERIRRISLLYTATQKKYTSQLRLNRDIENISLERQRQIQDNQNLRVITGN